MFQKKWLVIQLSGSWGGDLSHGKKKGRWARMSLQALLPSGTVARMGSASSRVWLAPLAVSLRPRRVPSGAETP